MPAPLPRGRRFLLAALLALGLAPVGWYVFAYGAAGLVLRAGDCAGRPLVDALVAGWLAVVVLACLAPPVLLFARGRWRPALVALGVGAAGALLYLAASLGLVTSACG